jgi:hypothetical protein
MQWMALVRKSFLIGFLLFAALPAKADADLHTRVLHLSQAYFLEHGYSSLSPEERKSALLFALWTELGRDDLPGITSEKFEELTDDLELPRSLDRLDEEVIDRWIRKVPLLSSFETLHDIAERIPLHQIPVLISSTDGELVKGLKKLLPFSASAPWSFAQAPALEWQLMRIWVRHHLNNRESVAKYWHDDYFKTSWWTKGLSIALQEGKISQTLIETKVAGFLIANEKYKVDHLQDGIRYWGDPLWRWNYREPGGRPKLELNWPDILTAARKRYASYQEQYLAGQLQFELAPLDDPSAEEFYRLVNKLQSNPAYEKDVARFGIDFVALRPEFFEQGPRFDWLEVQMMWSEHSTTSNTHAFVARWLAIHAEAMKKGLITPANWLTAAEAEFLRLRRRSTFPALNPVFAPLFMKTMSSDGTLGRLSPLAGKWLDLLLENQRNATTVPYLSSDLAGQDLRWISQQELSENELLKLLQTTETYFGAFTAESRQRVRTGFRILQSLRDRLQERYSAGGDLTRVNAATDSFLASFNRLLGGFSRERSRFDGIGGFKDAAREFNQTRSVLQTLTVEQLKLGRDLVKGSMQISRRPYLIEVIRDCNEIYNPLARKQIRPVD